MKKFLCVCLMLLMAGGAFAGDDYVGFLARLRTTPEEFFMLMKQSWANKGWTIIGGDHSASKAKFYDTMNMMQMALNRGEIGEMILPEFVAEYLLKVTDGYEACCMSGSDRMSLCFGFMRGNTELQAKWNEALRRLKDNFVLAGLERKYVKDFPPDDSYDYIYGINTTKKQRERRITFEHFPDAPTVRVAITGDLPPVDYVDESGLPAGYSVAVLSELAKIMRVNIQTVSVSAGARTAALVSGRADVVFWFEVDRKKKFQPDVPEDVILSEPYLDWNKFIHLTLSE